MRYFSGGLFHQNKFFPVKFIALNLFFPWVLAFYYSGDALVLVLVHVIYTTSTSSILLFLNASSFTSPLPHFHYFLPVLLLSPFEKHSRLYITTITSLIS